MTLVESIIARAKSNKQRLPNLRFSMKELRIFLPPISL